MHGKKSHGSSGNPEHIEYLRPCYTSVVRQSHSLISMQLETAETTPALPESLSEQIIPRLIAVLEHTQRSDSTATPESKQALLQAVRGLAPPHTSDVMSLVELQTNDYRSTLSQAKDYAAHLPGGELNAGEQKALIDMLEQLREHKRSVRFPLAVSPYSYGCTDSNLPSFRSVSSVLSSSGQNNMVEIDSTASTPVRS